MEICREGTLGVAEEIQKVAKVRESHPDVSIGSVRDWSADKNRLDVCPRLGHDLHDADRSRFGHDAGLVAGLLPGECERERLRDAVVVGPTVDRCLNCLSARSRSRKKDPLACQEQGIRFEVIDADDVREGDAVGGSDLAERVAVANNVGCQGLPRAMFGEAENKADG